MLGKPRGDLRCRGPGTLGMCPVGSAKETSARPRQALTTLAHGLWSDAVGVAKLRLPRSGCAVSFSSATLAGAARWCMTRRLGRGSVGVIGHGPPQ